MGRPKDTCPWLATTKTIIIQPLGGFSMTATDMSIDGIGTGIRTQAEINSADIYGYDFDAATETGTLLWAIPQDLDVASDITFKVLWANIDGVTTQTLTWKILYSLNVCDVDTALAVPSNALDTVIVADNELENPHAVQKSSGGILAGGTITAAQRDAITLMGLYVELDAISAGNGGNFLGLAITYTVRNIAGA